MIDTFNHKDARVLKLHAKGLKPAQIAKKLGYSGAAITSGIERVNDALRRAGIIKDNHQTHE